MARMTAIIPIKARVRVAAENVSSPLIFSSSAFLTLIALRLSILDPVASRDFVIAPPPSDCTASASFPASICARVSCTTF
jgi:hypothetical protein